MKKINILLLSLVALFSFSCVNDEGEGGISVVEGKVFKVMHYNNIYSFETDTFPAAKEDVYITYGDQPIYGDKMETGYDGYFRFQFLTKGTYKVFAYSSFPDGHKEAVIDTVTVAYGKTATTQNIYIHEGKSLETSYVKGSVLVNYYDGGTSYSILPGCDVRVYIRRAGAPYHFDEVRTGSDGVFMFQGLSVGTYEVFVLSESKGVKELKPFVKSVTITEKGSIVTVSEFRILINA